MKSHNTLSVRAISTQEVPVPATRSHGAPCADPAGEGGASHAMEPVFGMAVLYLLLPTSVVLVSFLSWTIAIPVVVASLACLGWLAMTLRRDVRLSRSDLVDSWPWLLMAAGFVWLSGALPPFAENHDWYKHYALFNELIDQSWPPAVPHVGGLSTLRYSLSYYVVPAIVAKHAGREFLGAAIFVWTTLGLYLSLTIAFTARAHSAASRLLLAAVFLLFSGADIVGRFITGFVHPLPMHFEWWATFGQLSSSVTSLFWTPQHAISAWLATFLILRFPAHAIRCAGVLAAAVAVWSPFSAIGLLPLFAWAIWKAGYRHIFTATNMVVAPVLLFAAGYFLTRGAASIPAGFIWTAKGFSIDTWVIFLVLEFGAIALSLSLIERRNAPLVLVAAGFLVLLSLVSMGAFNDLLMRASLPALAVLAALSASAAVYAPNTVRKAPLMICLVLGLITPLGEIMRGIVGERVRKSDMLRIDDVIGGAADFLAPQYLAPGYSGALRRTAVIDLSAITFSAFGNGQADIIHRRVVSSVFTDAALVSNPIRLSPGSYEVEIVLDLDVTAGPKSSHAAHLSLHGEQILIPIAGSAGKGVTLRGYFRTQGKPVQLSFGLGGWATGKGVIELKKLTISTIATTGR